MQNWTHQHFSLKWFFLALLFWALFAYAVAAFSGSAELACRGMIQDATIVKNLMVTQQWSADKIKLHAHIATDIDDARKRRIFALVDEAAVILALPCQDGDTACHAAKFLDPWIEKVRADCLTGKREI